MVERGKPATTPKVGTQKGRSFKYYCLVDCCNIIATLEIIVKAANIKEKDGQSCVHFLLKFTTVNKIKGTDKLKGGDF